MNPLKVGDVTTIVATARQLQLSGISDCDHPRLLSEPVVITRPGGPLHSWIKLQDCSKKVSNEYILRNEYLKPMPATIDLNTCKPGRKLRLRDGSFGFYYGAEANTETHKVRRTNGQIERVLRCGTANYDAKLRPQPWDVIEIFTLEEPKPSTLMSNQINLHEPPSRSDAKAFLNYQIAVMQAYADGKPVEFVGRAAIAYSNCIWSKCAPLASCEAGINFEWGTYTFRVTPPKIAEGHNPHKLTEEQVGVKDGWRLLTLEEIAAEEAKNRPTVGVEYWAPDTAPRGWRTNGTSGWTVYEPFAFRTKNPVGHYLPKPKTCREWLEELPEGYRQLAVKNHDAYLVKCPAYTGHKRVLNSIGGALLVAFCYEGTPEGHTFWIGVQTASAADIVPARPLPPLPKEKKLVPWTFDTCPMPGFLIRRKENTTIGPEVFAVHYKSLTGTSYGSYEYGLKNFEHSTDQGKTWHPCGTLE